jgi:DNA-binding SARP family transcriptional activator
MSGYLHVRLLGAFEVTLNGKPITIPSRTSQALLAYLALKATGRIRRERVAGDIWPDADEESSRAYLRNSLWQLRKLLGTGFFQADKIAIGMNPDAKIQLDTANLSGLDLQKTTTDKIMSGLEEYRGELLPGFYDEWLLAERAHITRLAVNGYRNLLERLLNEGRWNEAVSWAEKLIKTGEALEFAFCTMMKAYAGLEEIENVSLVYQRCIRELERDLSVSPSIPTRQLYEEIQNIAKTKTTPSKKANKGTPDQSHRGIKATSAISAAPLTSKKRRAALLLLVLSITGLSTVMLNRDLPQDLESQMTEGSAIPADVTSFPAGFDFSQLAQHNSGKSLPLSQRKELRVQQDGSIRILSMTGEFSDVRVENLVIKWASWAGDGKLILILASSTKEDSGFYEGDFYLIEQDGTGLVQLTFTEDSVFKGPPSISNDGTRILFSDGSAIKILSLLDGAIKTVVAADGGLSWIPDARWSRDETKIVFARSSRQIARIAKTR